MKNRPWRLIIHGGAGMITPLSIRGELEEQYRQGLKEALSAGSSILREGGTSVDAVVAAVAVMEDNPLFNAGRGSVFTHNETIEMDAAIMEGARGNAGAVCGVKGIRNPVKAARSVMEKSPHVLLTGLGAEEFARERKLVFEEESWFETELRRNQLKKALKSDDIQLDHDGKYGTVGAVALDLAGNTAAATSTGGVTNKLYGRVGDSPLIGAGTYADNGTVAVSATGKGEAFIRAVCAHRLSALIDYSELSLEEAGDLVLRKVAEYGGDGGLIALNGDGEFVMPFTTKGMFRGAAGSGMEEHIAIFGSEN